MSEVKVNKISPRTNCGTVQLGDSGDTITIPAGATITNNGTAAGFGSTGEVSWDTTKKTASFTGVSGVGYFVDTNSSAITVTLPASPSAGNVVAVSDYTGTFATNNCTIGRNGSNINGSANDFIIAKNNVTAQFIYVDATEGWRIVFTGSTTGEGLEQGFICATGGTVTTCGNCKIHTFTSPGTFTVNCVACSATNNVISYVVVAGGAAGGGSGDSGGGGGAGGFREYKSPITPYTASPLNGNPGGTEITVTAQGYPITVGGGGTAPGAQNRGGSGSNSVFSTVTSAGGGGGGAGPSGPSCGPGANGGSGGGGANVDCTGLAGGTGNTPPVTPPQGRNGGVGKGNNSPLPGIRLAGGGGGATAIGTCATNTSSGSGGAGATTCISGSPIAYAGGGGGGAHASGSDTTPPTNGGTGGGGAGGNDCQAAAAGTTNRGGGGGGGKSAPGSPQSSANGGSGVVIIRYKYQ